MYRPVALLRQAQYKLLPNETFGSSYEKITAHLWIDLYFQRVLFLDQAEGAMQGFMDARVETLKFSSPISRSAVNSVRTGIVRSFKEDNPIAPRRPYA